MKCVAWTRHRLHSLSSDGGAMGMGMGGGGGGLPPAGGPDENLEEQRTRLQQRSNGSNARYQQEEYDAGENDWSVTYTDMVTLLMIFFAVLTAISMMKDNPVSQGQTQDAYLQQAPVKPSPFDGTGLTIADFGAPSNMNKVPADVDDPEAIDGTFDPAPTGLADGGKLDQDELVIKQPPAPEETELAQKLNTLVQKDNLAGQVQVLSAGDTVTLRISDKILFPSGQANLQADGSALVQKLSSVLKESGGQISIEGHTDNVPIATAQFPSNWELSSARAAMVLRQLASLGLPADKMRAIAYADTKPVQDNSSAENRASNRRVEIVISTK